MRPDRKARELADAEDVEIRTYEIIYNLLEDIENAMVGMLAPEFEEVVTGEAEVREIFRVPRVGAIAGCYVQNGTITRGSKVRFLREGTIIWKGTITSLKRFKDDAREVASRLRVRHRPLGLPGPQARRHHRDLRGAGDRPHLMGRGATGGSAARRGAAVALAGILLATVAVFDAAPARADASRYASDQLNTGWYPDQPGLSPQIVSGGTFGQMFDTALPDGGNVYAQPVVSNGTLLAVTEEDDAYGLDPQTGALRWSADLGVSVQPR